jgi:hypothetical protein
MRRRCARLWPDGLLRRTSYDIAVPVDILAFHLLGLGSASFIRKVEWRGITYEVDGSGRVRLLDYQPYQQAAVHVRQADASLV